MVRCGVAYPESGALDWHTHVKTYMYAEQNIKRTHLPEARVVTHAVPMHVTIAASLNGWLKSSTLIDRFDVIN